MAIWLSKDGGIVARDEKTKKITANLSSDTKSEVTNSLDPATIEGFPKGYSLDKESTVMTAAFEIGTLKSDGTWSWA